MDSARQQPSPILRIPETVRQDVLEYRTGVAKFLKGETSPVAFRAYRVPMGIYEQRSAGKYMVRIRIGAGLVLPYQLERIALLSKTYGNGIVHVTTRQDIQIHEVKIEDTPDVLEGLLEVGLSARGGGGNTVRNVAACPRAGVCPNEEFDVAPYAIATAEYLLQDRASFNLPRKYKIAFSGCSADCALSSVADLGFFAHQKDGVKGFSVYAGGGLGPNPAVAVKIEEFISDSEVLEVAEATRRLFDKYGDRSNRNKARLRYVLRRTGQEEFVKLYKNERAELSKIGLKGQIPKVRDITYKSNKLADSSTQVANQYAGRSNVLPEKTEGLFTAKINLILGDINADDLSKIGQIAKKFGDGIVRTSQLQDILITGIPQGNIDDANNALNELGFDVVADNGPKVVACTGAATCKLGLCLSRGLANAITEKITSMEVLPEFNGDVIRISGCSNSCGHHYIAALGFQGKAKRVKGKLMPCYDVLVGAKMAEGKTQLAKKIGTVPAKRIPELVTKALKNGTVEAEQVKNIIDSFGDFAGQSFPDEYYHDYGSNEAFSLAGRGPGECGAGVMDVIKFDIDEAKYAIKLACKSQEAEEKSQVLYKAIVAATRALLFVFGQEPKKDREVFALFAKHLIEPGWVKPEAQQIIDQAIDFRMDDKVMAEDALQQIENLTERVEELFLSLDANLKFKIETAVAKTANIDKTKTQNHMIDLRGVQCPLNFVKAKLELEKIAVGQILEILLDDGGPIRNVPESFVDQGQEVVEIKNKDDHCSVKVLRKK